MTDFTQFDPNKTRYLELYFKRKQRRDMKLKLLLCSYFVYPIIRFIVNLICLILMAIRYISWYQQHANLSDWQKYCGFIIIHLYMPMLKGHGFFTILDKDVFYKWTFYHFEDVPSWVTFIISILDISFVVWLLLISIPFWFAEMFIFIPTTIIIMLCGLILFVYTRYTTYSW